MIASFAGFFLAGLTLAFNAEGDDWVEVDDHELYTFEIPSYMYASNELNDEASHQFEYIFDSEKDGLLESYVIVLFETKEEIEGYELDITFDADSYWQMGAEGLGESISRYKILSKSPVILDRNGLRFMHGIIYGRLGLVKVMYHYGVYEGEHAFYQVLAWTLKSQEEMFKDDLEKIVGSLREK